jgi:branched-chain amino acid transport system ATP-binding protein
VSTVVPAPHRRHRRRDNPWILEVRNVTVEVGSVRAIDGADVRIPYGGFIGVMGPNGAGKTTLFNVITGFVRPSAGVVRFRGRRISEWPTYRRARAGIGRTFQNIGLNKQATVLENLWVATQAGSLGRECASWSTGSFGHFARGREDIVGILERLGLIELLDRPVVDLPHGTAKLAELACVLSRRPLVLLLDEPTSGLGPEETDELASVLLDLHASQPITIVVIEHDMPFVARCSEEVHVLDSGRILTHGTPAEIARHPDVITAYLGQAAGAVP